MKKPKVTISYPGAMLNIMVKVSLGLQRGATVWAWVPSATTEAFGKGDSTGSHTDVLTFLVSDHPASTIQIGFLSFFVF